MKKITLLLVFVAASLAVSAQIPMGTKYVGGSVGFNSSKSTARNAEAVTSYSLSPEVGYFFMENMAAGLRLGINGSSQKDNFSSTAFGVGAYVRKFWNASDNLHIFVGLGVDYAAGTVKDETPINGPDQKLNTFGAGLDLGLWYHLSERWSLVGRIGTLGFSSTSNPDNDQVGSTDFGLNVNTLGNPFSIGVYYSF